jgi:hypothetical protein
VVNVSDVNCILLHALAVVGGNAAPACAAADASATDLDCSGEVNVADVVMCIQVALGTGLSALVDTDADLCPDTCSPPNPLWALADDFSSEASLQHWTERSAAEGDAALHSHLDVGVTTPGWLTVDPNAYDDPRFSDAGQGPGWFQDRHGVYLFREVEGDFAVRTRVRVGTVQSMAQGPLGNYNAAGILVRDPASFSATSPNELGAESWIVYNIGRQDGFTATEIKTTYPDGFDSDSESDSTLFLHSAPALSAELIVCRVGAAFSFYRRFEGAQTWQTENIDSLSPTFNGAGLVGPQWSAGFTREDLPSTVQVGLMVNRWSLGGGSPVRAQFDFFDAWLPDGPTGCLPPP